MNSIRTEIQDFLDHCEYEKNLCSKTILAYKIDLNQFTEFILNKYKLKELKDISKIEIRDYLKQISPLKPKSIKRKIASIKSMFNYLEFEDRIQINPFRKMKIKIKEPKYLPEVMNQHEINEIIQQAYQGWHKQKEKKTFSYFESIRNAVVVELLFTTGARVSEIADIKIKNINLNTGTIYINGKGNKERIIQICNKETLELLQIYFSILSQRESRDIPYFLLNRFGKKISDQSIRGIVKKISCKTNIKKRITPHVFRHTLATLLLENDVDIKYIQTILGHSSIMTTQIYTHVNGEKQRKILALKHPREDISISRTCSNA